MYATWDDESGFQEDSDNEEAILCFMSIEKKSNEDNEDKEIASSLENAEDFLLARKKVL